jgi:hypothetical protein
MILRPERLGGFRWTLSFGLMIGFFNRQSSIVNRQLERWCPSLRRFVFCFILIGMEFVPGELFAQQTQPETPFSTDTVWIEHSDRQERDDTLPLLYLGLILLGILLFGILKWYKHAQNSDQLSQDSLGLRQQKRQQLLKDIACLDDRYAQGMIQEQAYSLERKQIKQRLVELTIQCKRIA